MKNRIAIIVTTMLRDDLLLKAIKSMKAHLPENAIILIGDQGNQNIDVAKITLYENMNCYYYVLPFNCGLSKARNYLVEQAHNQGCEYCIIASDSMIFNEKTEFIDTLIPLMEAPSSYSLIGCHLNGAQIYWVGWLTLIPGKCFELDFIDRSQTSPGRLNLFDCSSCHNFFIATTKSLIDVKWDDNLKLAEHEDFFYRYTQAGYKCAWTPDVSCDYFKTRYGQHAAIRQQNWNESLPKLLGKWKINQWISQKNRQFGFYGGVKI